MEPNFASKTKLKSIFSRYGLLPSKGLGQHFLIDKLAINKVLKAAKLTKKDTVLEVGPGLGALTQELAKAAGRVIAVEKDLKMIEILKEVLKDVKNVEIIHGDILKFKNLKYSTSPKIYPPKASKLKIKDFKVVANLPFYLTAPVIRQFLESQNPPKDMILVVQKEVGQRICQKPPKMNLLAVSVQFYAEPEIISYISKKSFWPEPKVDSAIIKISSIKDQISKINTDLFFKIVKAGFSHPRKTLTNNLAKKLNIKKNKIVEILQKNHILLLQRPETLKISDWQNLTKEFSASNLL